MVKLEQNVKNLIVEVEKMIVPIRCWSCGKPIAHLWEEYQERLERGEDRKKILDGFGLKRYCCRAMFMGHVDLIDIAARFKKV